MFQTYCKWLSINDRNNNYNNNSNIKLNINSRGHILKLFIEHQKALKIQCSFDIKIEMDLNF